MSNSSDRDLGMHRGITRRDFINGVALPVGGALVLPRAARALGQAPAPEQAADYYPLRRPVCVAATTARGKSVTR